MLEANMLKANNNSIFRKIIMYLFAIITLLQCNSIYLYSDTFHLSKGVLNISWQIVLLIIMFSLVKKNIHPLNNIHLSIFVLIFSFISIFFIFYEFIIYPSFNKALGFKLFIDMILLVFFFYYLRSNNRTFYPFVTFENIVVLLSIVSLICWIAFILKIPTNTSTFINWGLPHYVPGYLGIDFFTQLNQGMTAPLFPRNSGIFAEPSMFSYVIIISLLIEFFMRKTKKELNYRIIILLITVVTTASTTGILVSFIALVYYVFIINKNKGIKNIILLMLIPFLFVFLRTVFLNKLGSNQAQNLGSSSSIRFDDIKAGLKAWKYHLFLGSGLGKESLIEKNVSLWRFTMTSHPKSSAGFSTILAEGGTLLGLFYILPTIIVSKYSSRFLGLSIFSFIPLIFVVSQGYYIYLMLLAYFWVTICCYNKNEL